VAGSCEYDDEPSGSGATELVIVHCLVKQVRAQALLCCE
jgi:hypothetical protein